MLILAAIVLVALFRVACFGASVAPLKFHRITIAGVSLGLASWVAGALLQAWVPLWEMLAVGLTLTALAAVLRPTLSIYSQPMADFLAIAMLGPLSVISVRPEFVIVAALVFAFGGFVIDQVMARVSARLHPKLLAILQPMLLAMPIVLVLLLGLQVTQPGNFGSRLLKEDALFPLRMALAVPAPGGRLPLEHPTAAWLREVAVGEARGTAILLHGNHWRGSRQPTAMALQGALLRAGYSVLSVDHPGSGESPVPSPEMDWRAWDPTLGALEALTYLTRTKHTDPSRTIVVGHSMGADVALKFVASAPVHAVFLWGASLDRPYGPNWQKNFYKERNIPCCLPPATMNKIREEFYGGADRFAAVLPADHASVHYVRFGIEHADVTRDREPLYAAITEPKKLCDFASVSHYFNTLALRGFALIETRTIQRAAEIFKADKGADENCGR